MDKIIGELKEQMGEAIKATFDEETVEKLKKKVSDAVADAQEYILYDLKDQLAAGLVGWVTELAGNSVEQLLKGNEDQMRRYLGCEKRGPDGNYIGWTGRSTEDIAWGRAREQFEWHPIIHGRLFEQGALALRKQIVEAHRDLLVNECVLDLEDQVKSLVAQNVKLIQEREQERDRYRQSA